MAISTSKTYLGYAELGTDGSVDTIKSFDVLCPIKSFGALGGTPNTIDTTTMSDEGSTSILGNQSLDPIEFTANWVREDYLKIKEISESGKKHVWCLLFKDKSPWVWQGDITAFPSAGEVDAVVEMTFVISAGTFPKLSTMVGTHANGKITLADAT